MRQHLFISLRMTAVLLVLTCGLYPAVVWAVGQVAFRHQANGSLISRGGRIVGSELVGQNFSGDRFFHPRPSAAGAGYDATASGGTNLGPTSSKLRDAIAARVRAWNDLSSPSGLPADAVTASASGLDPHISPENAALQAPRVARANGLPEGRVLEMIRARTEGRLLGVFGAPRVNVLLLNLDLLEFGRRAPGVRRSSAALSSATEKKARVDARTPHPTRLSGGHPLQDDESVRSR